MQKVKIPITIDPTRTAQKRLSYEGIIPMNTLTRFTESLLVKEGDVVEAIIGQAAEYKCDLIIMGANEGLLSSSSVGSTIKSVLKKSKIPVMVVPVTLGE